MFRLFKHYVPHAVLLLGFFDLALLGLAAEIGWVWRAHEIGMEIDPLSQVRLARLHGRPMPDRLDLRQTARWAECRSAVDHCRDAPQLRLDA